MMIKKCLVCSYPNLKLVFTKKPYQIFQCQKCRFGMLKDYPTLQKTKQIYEKDYFGDKLKPEFMADAKKKFSFVKKYLLPKARILDFGCGLGDFISLAKINNYDVYGYDISSYAAKFVSRKYRLPTFSSRLKVNLFKKNYFDAIVCFDVIEHIPNLKTILKLFRFWLKPNGFLFLTTPNIESWDAKILKSHWYGFTKIPEHINYFSPQSIKLTLEKNRFQIKRIQTWGFVRSFDFVFKKIEIGQSLLTKRGKPWLKLFRWLIAVFRLNKKLIYLPMVDMMVVAQKP